MLLINIDKKLNVCIDFSFSLRYDSFYSPYFGEHSIIRMTVLYITCMSYKFSVFMTL